jgi:small subunit ribosomal protein S1
MSWTKRVQHPSEVVRKGDDVEVVVLGVDPENKRISLGSEADAGRPVGSAGHAVRAGVEKDGKVVRLLEDGVVVDLGDDVEGFVPRSQIEIPSGEAIENYVREGVEVPVRVIEFDLANRRIVLTPTRELERQPDLPPEGAPSPGDEEGETADAGEATETPQAPAAEADEAPAAETEAAPAAEAPAAEPDAPAAEAPASDTVEAPASEADEAPAAEAEAPDVAEPGEPSGAEAASSATETAGAPAQAEGEEVTAPVEEEPRRSEEQA